MDSVWVRCKEVLQHIRWEAGAYRALCCDAVQGPNTQALFGQGLVVRFRILEFEIPIRQTHWRVSQEVGEAFKGNS